LTVVIRICRAILGRMNGSLTKTAAEVVLYHFSKEEFGLVLEVLSRGVYSMCAVTCFDLVSALSTFLVFAVTDDNHRKVRRVVLTPREHWEQAVEWIFKPGNFPGKHVVGKLSFRQVSLLTTGCAHGVCPLLKASPTRWHQPKPTPEIQPSMCSASAAPSSLISSTTGRAAG
jgi:hypothetical protein